MVLQYCAPLSNVALPTLKKDLERGEYKCAPTAARCCSALFCLIEGLQKAWMQILGMALPGRLAIFSTDIAARCCIVLFNWASTGILYHLNVLSIRLISARQSCLCNDKPILPKALEDGLSSALSSQARKRYLESRFWTSRIVVLDY
jgi:hypothetical protein